MRKLVLIACISLISTCYHKGFAQSDAIYPVYNGTDLGCTYRPNETSIRVYAPSADSLRVLVYKQGRGGKHTLIQSFSKAESGTWLAKLTGDWLDYYYTVQACFNGVWSMEVTDPYAKAVGVNGNRVQIISLQTTNPLGWENDVVPVYSQNNATQDAIIYEAHVRDLTMHESSGIKNNGKFIGLTETNTENHYGMPTVLSHLKELGITHLHLLPVFDYNSVDEENMNNGQYNWGYDPKNYNTPEGSYSTNSEDGKVRIKEFKQMVQAIHNAGMRVVMDVVYNHTALTNESNFNQLVPGYYYRIQTNGDFANASGCGNETASDKPMMRKFIIESVLYWVNEYHIDGFRFDLMAIHDIETMNLLADTLRKIKPDILIYGEGWAAGSPAYPEQFIALKRNVHLLKGIAVFSDDIRDAVKGYVFDSKAKGYVQGNSSMKETVKFGIVGALPHQQVNMKKAFYDKVPYANSQASVINYVDCHDNLVLWDKLQASAANQPDSIRKKMQMMAYGIVLTSQGIPFIHAGSEFLRSKKGEENSYNKPDEINAIDWDLKKANEDVFLFIQQLIAIRKQQSLFRLNSAQAIQQQVSFLTTTDDVLAYTLTAAKQTQGWKKIMVIINTSNKEMKLPCDGNWSNALSNALVTINKNSITVGAYSFTICYSND
ncbi:MAG: type I pullulanase [Bacteroidia bacterium]|nr:type I pullulanase [Bacteroidia bacterium]